MLVWHLIVAGDLVFLLQVELSFPVNSIYNTKTCPPTSLLDSVLYPKWVPLILQAPTVSIAVALFGRTFRCRLNSCVVRSWVHAGRHLWGRAALAQQPFSAVAQSKCLGNSRRNKTYRDNWVFWLLRSRQAKWLRWCKPKAEAQILLSVLLFGTGLSTNITLGAVPHEQSGFESVQGDQFEASGSQVGLIL